MFSGALQAASGRIQDAAEELQLVWLNVREHWQDAQAARFEQDRLHSVMSEVQTAIPAITQMGQILGQALRECNEPQQT